MVEYTYDGQLPKLGFGAGVFSGRYNAFERDKTTDLVRTSLELGVNYFDTSPYYNDSEVILGDALHAVRADHPRDTYYLTTKIGRYGHTAQDFDYSASRVNQSITQSLQRLHTNYLDIALCHDVEFVHQSEVTDHALPELYRLKHQGTVRMVGISGYPLDTLLAIATIQHAKNEPLDVVMSYCHYNFHNQMLATYAPKFRAAGVRFVINASPLSMGLLRDDANSPPHWHPACAQLKRVAAHARVFCQEQQHSLASVALAYCFAQTVFDCTVVGISSKPELEEAVRQYKAVAEGSHAVDRQTQKVTDRLLELFAPFKGYTWPSP
ncbi:hypothetical protein H4R35_002162 [Dimargaris xerosporica]|nr:hypothetical protein H4R35_002162 [Dimargaris xerosporica]